MSLGRLSPYTHCLHRQVVYDTDFGCFLDGRRLILTALTELPGGWVLMGLPEDYIDVIAVFVDRETSKLLVY